MNKHTIEKSIKRSIALSTPDLFEQIASAPVQKLPEEDYIVKPRTTTTKRSISKLHALYTACTSIAILFAICFGLAHNYYSIDSIVAIDVNPSVEIILNKSYHVLSVRANNEDGEKLIQNKHFKNKTCDAVIEELTVSLSDEGYINKNKNSILVSVSNSNEIKAEEVKSRVITDIKTTLNKQEIEPVIYNQSMSNSTTKELEALAKKYHTSFGKMKLINSLIEKDPSLTIEELVSLPISEIPEYVNKRKIQMADVIQCEQGTSQVAVAALDESKTKAKNQSNSDEKTTVSSTEMITNSKEETTSTSTSQPMAMIQQPIVSSEVSSPTTGSATTSQTGSTQANESNTSKHCAICSEACTCPNCSSDKTCEAGCDLCTPECPNSTQQSNSSVENQTGSTKPNKNENQNHSNKPNKNENQGHSNKPNKGEHTNEPDDIVTSGSVNTSTSTETTTDSSSETTTESTTESDTSDDLQSSGTIESQESTTPSSPTEDLSSTIPSTSNDTLDS